MKIRLPLILLVLVLFLLSSVRAGAYTDADCIECHDRGGEGSVLKMSVEQFNRSIHRSIEGEEISCQECHVNVEDEEHQETPGSGAVDCTQCHDRENRHGTPSIGRRPKCFDCHARHNIRSKEDPQASVHADRLEQTCKACHPLQSGAMRYFSWFTSIQIASHPKQDFSFVYTRQNCLGCHQGKAAHGETAPVNDQNCHVCHLGDDGKHKLLGVIHPDAKLATQPGVFTAAFAYQLALFIMVISGFRRLVRYFSKRKE